MGAKIPKKTIKELDYFISDDFKKPKFWDYNKPNIFAYILSPIAYLIKLINFFKKLLDLKI